VRQGPPMRAYLPERCARAIHTPKSAISFVRRGRPTAVRDWTRSPGWSTHRRYHARMVSALATGALSASAFLPSLWPIAASALRSQGAAPGLASAGGGAECWSPGRGCVAEFRLDGTRNRDAQLLPSHGSATPALA